MVEEEVLPGGVANAGGVVRVGPHVLRPSNPHTESIHALLRALRARGFAGAPLPLGVDPDGRERLAYIEGDVAIPPFPDWVQTDAVLAGIALLLRGLHDASRIFDSSGFTWSDELADPGGGPVMCHNDVCLENVVIRDGIAVGLLDFDFAAPGTSVHDLALFTLMCVPVDDPGNAASLGWLEQDCSARLRLVADTYGLDAPDRRQLHRRIGLAVSHGGEFVRRRVEAGDPNFIQMWEELGGAARYERRRQWWDREEPNLLDALLSVPTRRPQARPRAT